MRVERPSVPGLGGLFLLGGATCNAVRGRAPRRRGLRSAAAGRVAVRITAALGLRGVLIVRMTADDAEAVLIDAAGTIAGREEMELVDHMVVAAHERSNSPGCLRYRQIQRFLLRT